MKTKIKIGRTIPFGYKIGKNSKILYPISTELEILKQTLIQIKSGKLSLRQASKEIQIKTKRNLSHPALLKMTNKKFPNWQIQVKKENLRIRDEKNRIKKLKILRIKEEREKKRLNKLSSQNRINKKCIICLKIKLLRYFPKLKTNRVRYCEDCYKLILKKSKRIKKKCSQCKKVKNLNGFSGSNGLIAYRQNHCRKCNIKRNLEWKKQNRDKINTYNKRYRMENPELIKKQTRRYYLKNREKLLEKKFEYNKKNKDKIRKKRKIYWNKIKNNKELYQKHLIKSRIYSKNSRLKDLEKARSDDKKYYYKNREKVIQRVMNWKKNNMDKVLKSRRRYNLRRNEVEGNKKSLW